MFTPLSLNMIMDDGHAPVPGKAVSYDRTSDGRFPVIDHPWPVPGPGGVHTTPSELVRWADNYRTDRLGGPELIKAQLAEPTVACNAHIPRSMANALLDMWT